MRRGRLRAGESGEPAGSAPVPVVGLESGSLVVMFPFCSLSHPAAGRCRLAPGGRRVDRRRWPTGADAAGDPGAL
ncbi:hypothetical protein GCM10022230_14470 [Pseudoclavibacter caeni]